MAKTKDKTKKSKTIEQIEKLEKALKENEAQDVVNLVPEEVKADIEADKHEADALETPKEIDVEAEVKKIIEDAEPSEEVKAQVEDFETGKEQFNKKIEAEPENAEKIVEAELKRVEALKKKAEALKNKRHTGNEGFTNWWNGASGLY